jgi:GNAT superfamily N-acetyltransferase
MRARGIAETAAESLGRARAAWTSEGAVVFHVKALSVGTPPEPPGRSIVRRATPDDAAAYARDIGTDSAGTFARRLSPETDCWLLIENDRILHASWATTSPAWTRELRAFFRPPAGDLYTYESFTRPEGRGRGAYPIVLAHLCADAAGRGLRRAWVGVEADNAPSLRAVAKAGFQPAFRVRFRRRLGRLWTGEPEGEGASSCEGCVTPLPSRVRRSH